MVLFLITSGTVKSSFIETEIGTWEKKPDLWNQALTIYQYSFF